MTFTTVLERAERYRAQLEARTMTIREVAKKVGCHESYLSKVLSHTLNRVQSSSESRKKASLLREYRTKLRQKHAILVKTGQKSLKKASADARCSERTMRRYIAALAESALPSTSGSELQRAWGK